MQTPDILTPALRQYQHNNCSGLKAGFDYDETIRVVNLMEKALKAQARLLAAYRSGGQPPEWVFCAIENVQKLGIKL